MYSVLAFLCTLVEIGAVAAGYLMHSQIIFFNAVIYGSPFYMIQHAIGKDSLFHQENPIYWGIAAFHIIKYFIFFQAQAREDRNAIRTIALILEAGYLGLCTYYLL